MKALFLFTVILGCVYADVKSQVTITVNALQPAKAISPYIYGKNNSLSDNSFGTYDPMTAAEWQKLRDLGIQMFRENGGNNATKYNWRRKLSSHPDWYNNVYAHDWDYAAGTLQNNIPSAQGMWAFQLCGKAAKTAAYNFNDWAYNSSNWWSGCRQNLAGNGEINEAGGEDALTDGNPELYLENWNADSTTGILDHWFGTDGIGLDKNKILYWSMDNEPEIWNGTHDDIWPTLPTAETFMQQYFAVAKIARQKFPGIKLTGPVPANEWQWYNWNGDKVSYNGKQYPWLEYFILRVAEEQQASGMRLLDVLDIHFYPGDYTPAEIAQIHRVFFDTTYVYPGANGVKRSGTGSWDNSLNKEYIFKRCNDWLNKYIGPNHGVTFSLSETSLYDRSNPSLTAIWYASMLGEFARNGVEIFTPWDWSTGMSEVVHLFSHYGNKLYVPAVSSNEFYVSAYPTRNQNNDSMTIFLVNRHLTETQTVNLQITDYTIKDGTYKFYTLSGLPAAETFVSHTTNALKKTDVTITGNKASVIMQPLSVSALVVPKNITLHNDYGELIGLVEAENATLSGVTIANVTPGYSGTGYVTSFDTGSDKITASVSITTKDVYRLVVVYTSAASGQHKVTVNNNYTNTADFPVTNGFSSTDAGFFLLNAGSNSISLSQLEGTAEIDRIELYAVVNNQYEIDDLSDTNASNETRQLYNFLQYQFGKRIISGQTSDYYTQVTSLGGKSPMIRAGDFQHFTQGYPYLWVGGRHTFGYDISDQTVNSLINWYNSTGKKGIVAIQWHWHDPSGALNSTAGTNTFYTSSTTFDIRQAVIPGTPEYNFVIRDIDSIAFQLKKLQKAGVPILWRPLHEAGGGWFWWGAKGAAPCLALWDILIERLRNYHQLHNLIWVWSTPEPNWYPGNEKVDIIGFDSYPGSFNYTTQKSVFDNLYTLTQGKKMIAMSENGPIPDPDNCLNEDAPWLYFTSWSNLVAEQNTQGHIQDVFSNPVVLTLESTNALTGFEWRSALYPENWRPGYKDSQGRFLHDFSYAGYHKGEENLPNINDNIIDVTQAPYHADNTGANDATLAIQNALNDAGQAGGGVVFLPEGTYKISVAESALYALKIGYDSIVLRGAGKDKTFIKNVSVNMRQKDIISIYGGKGSWFSPKSPSSNIVFDLPEPTRVIPVQSVAGFIAGQNLIITSTPTEAFIAEHRMTGYWTATDIKGVAFMRTIISVDTKNNLLIVDAPTRYPLKVRDLARVYSIDKQISECGIEDLSIGNLEHTGTGWEEESYTDPSTGAYEVHNSHVINFRNALNCWIKNVSTFKPAENLQDYHLLSNGIKLNQSRFITIDSCNFEKSQYEGGGGNGYMFTIESNDCLIKNSRANHGRHNYDFKYPYSNGNVILHCRGENSKYASDFHMYLSMSNLLDACTFNKDFIESTFRPYGGSSLHGYTSSQSVFYNTMGEAYHPDKNYLIESKQFGMGYIIGTSGNVSNVLLDPVEGTLNGYPYNTSPRDYSEGVGKGQYLIPTSLYLDQLERRRQDTIQTNGFQVKIIVKDSDTKALLSGCQVRIYNDTLITDANGSAIFQTVPEFFQVNISRALSTPILNQPFMIHSDTVITFLITRQKFAVTVKLVRAGSQTPLTGTTVTLNTMNQVTNSSGETTFNVYGGPQNYSVNKISYQQEQGIFNIESDTLVQISLVQTHATLRIRLRVGTTPVNNASVIANNDTVMTNSLGDAVFSLIPVSAEYAFIVRKNGYQEKTGNVYFTKDTIVIVPMSLAVSSNTHTKNNLKFWPNPADNILNLEVPADFIKGTYNIVDFKGIELLRGNVESNLSVIDISSLNSGGYIMHVKANNSTGILSFIKK